MFVVIDNLLGEATVVDPDQSTLMVELLVHRLTPPELHRFQRHLHIQYVGVVGANDFTPVPRSPCLTWNDPVDDGDSCRGVFPNQLESSGSAKHASTYDKEYGSSVGHLEMLSSNFN